MKYERMNVQELVEKKAIDMFNALSPDEKVICGMIAHEISRLIEENGKSGIAAFFLNAAALTRQNNNN